MEPRDLVCYVAVPRQRTAILGNPPAHSTVQVGKHAGQCWCFLPKSRDAFGGLKLTAQVLKVFLAYEFIPVTLHLSQATLLAACQNDWMTSRHEQQTVRVRITEKKKNSTLDNDSRK
jgi:hypothetical protein